jgi:hypothetical protein
MAKCIYCEIDRKISREHILPNFIEKRTGKAGLYFTAAANKYVEGAPTVRDVCRVCNEGILSRLDAYASKLFDMYFTNPIVSPVSFKCQPDDFCRWVLKVLFNGQRGFGGTSKPFLPYRGYILNKDPPPRRVLLFGSVMGPSRLNGQLIFPRDHRVSDLRLPELELGVEFELAYMLTLNSYSFCVVSMLGEVREDQASRVIQYLGNALGASLMDGNGTITFDPSSATIDHVSNKVRQAMHKPAQYGKNGYVEVNKKTYLMTAFPAGNLPSPRYRDGKVTLATIPVGGRHYAVVGLWDFPSRLDEVDQELGAPIRPSSRAYARIERRSFKTYLFLIDPLELDAPHLKAVAGIAQSDENWLMWKRALESNRLLYVCGAVGQGSEPVRVRCAVEILFRQ